MPWLGERPYYLSVDALNEVPFMCSTLTAPDIRPEDPAAKNILLKASHPKMRRTAHLYHLAEADNVTSILENGLMSTEELLISAGVPEVEREVFLRTHRTENVRLSNGVVIRDQKPMPPTALAPVLDDGLEPPDWYALLNGFVFLWPDRERMVRLRSARGNHPQILLTFDSAVLLDRFAAHAYVSPINSGNARRKPARRGRDTLIPYTTWLREGWRTGQRNRPPAEFLFRCPIPARAPYLVDVANM